MCPTLADLNPIGSGWQGLAYVAVLAVGALGGWLLKYMTKKWTRERQSEESALAEYKKLVRAQDTRIGKLEKRCDLSDRRERACRRRVDRMALRVESHEEAMRAANIPFKRFEDEDEDEVEE